MHKKSIVYLASVLFLMMGFTLSRTQAQIQPGHLDTSLNPGLGATRTGSWPAIYASAIQPDGKIILGGSFHHYNNFLQPDLVRINTDGSLDPGFILNVNFGGTVEAIALQPDGKILIGGHFTATTGFNRSYLARLNADGSLDLSFFHEVSGEVHTIVVQPDGKVIIGGFFYNFDGEYRYNIARLKPNGYLDNDFMSDGNGADNRVLTAALQPDGKIIIGGDFTSINGIAKKYVARLNANGTLDNTFNVAAAGISGSAGTTPYVKKVAVQPDGAILIGGYFSAYNSAPRKNIVRVNANGSLDATFTPGNGTNGEVAAFALQPDGKINMGGGFTNYNNIPRNRIARLNANGTLDTDFTPGSGASSSIFSIQLQPDGKIIAAGTFTTYNGTPRSCIARIYGEVALALPDETPGILADIYPNPFRNEIHVALPSDITGEASITLHSLTGAEVYSKRLEANASAAPLRIRIVPTLQNGLYYLQIKTNNQVFGARIVKL